jgi:transcriptional regulator with XRE-family HTH domain
MSMAAAQQNVAFPLPVVRTLKKLGEDLALARRRRRISMASMAERLQLSTATVRRMEKGDPTVAIGTIARALLIFNAGDRLGQLLDTASDDVGLQLMDEAVPKRIRTRPLTPSSGAL